MRIDKLFFGGISVFIAGIFALIIAGVSCNAVGNVSGKNHDKAVAAAHAWAQEMGLDATGVSCANSDTNGDGYVSCSVSSKKSDGSVQIIPIECAASFTFNSGCRAARIIPTAP